MERDMQRKVQMIESGEGCYFKPMPELCEAAERGDLATLTSLIAKKANPDTRGENGNTALAFAAANGHADCCSFLLQSKADISAQSDWGSTSLHAAAWADCAKVIKLLVRAKANINAQQPNGATPLHFAVESKREGSVRALCMAGANRTLKRDGRTPLMEAVTLKAKACELVLREFDATEKAEHERKLAAMLKDKEAKANAAAEALLAELADLRCPSCAASRRINDPSALNPLPLRREEPSNAALNHGYRRHHPTTHEEQLFDDSDDDSAHDVVEVVENGRTTVVIDRYGVHEVK
ncbi:hypothetical protein Ctob_014367 [Chrysochromulina tobinii]|uniref:Uncharacterized protein n=1 Tax=Chrysochromulina tobinii TaxID=1460289 RepID=A0A0M0LQI7_9EUKA|nr:hypothetical protein Ctob_014367 [Chrysochromulina tobinii]|eukprot:KOO53266.1 hypothetical protein Ctob_014367 [Chrysochromulina sp. CCMP291]